MFSVFQTVCVFALLATFSEATVNTCEEPERNFADVCFSPTKIVNYDFKWTLGAQPSDGWYLSMTNEITKLQYSDIFHGNLSARPYNLDNPCFRSKVVLGDGTKKLLDGHFYGFGQPAANWACNASLDYPGVFKCELSSSVTNYYKKLNLYPIYVDHKNMQVMIVCFSNGQVGWQVFSITPTLTDEEKGVVSALIRSFGFADDTTVRTYTENCSHER